MKLGLSACEVSSAVEILSTGQKYGLLFKHTLPPAVLPATRSYGWNRRFNKDWLLGLFIALLLMVYTVYNVHCNYSSVISIDEVCRIFTRKNPRRLEVHNMLFEPLAEKH